MEKTRERKVCVWESESVCVCVHVVIISVCECVCTCVWRKPTRMVVLVDGRPAPAPAPELRKAWQRGRGAEIKHKSEWVTFLNWLSRLPPHLPKGFGSRSDATGAGRGQTLPLFLSISLSPSLSVSFSSLSLSYSLSDSPSGTQTPPALWLWSPQSRRGHAQVWPSSRRSAEDKSPRRGAEESHRGAPYGREMTAGACYSFTQPKS